MISCPLFNSSGTPKFVSLSSREAELHAIVSSASGLIYVRAVLEFALGTGGPLHLCRFLECTPTCDEESSWKSETLGWTVVMGSMGSMGSI